MLNRLRTDCRLFRSNPEMGCERWLRSAFLGRPTSYPPASPAHGPYFYVVSDQKKHSELFLGEDPGRWAQTTYVQRS
jgi:hypothetical protein